jgi:enterochelin esterase-like enzyme
MKALFTLIIFLPCTSFGQYAQGRIDEDMITTKREVNKIYYAAYFPPDYDLSPTRKYPIIYFLSSAIDHNDWIKHGEVNKMFDKLIAERKIPPFIGIMLCGAPYKSPEEWKNLFEEDIIKIVERRVRAYPESRSKRAIIGFSLGGYYAIKSSVEMTNKFLCSIAFCPLYTSAINSVDHLVEVYEEQSKRDLVGQMINGIEKIENKKNSNFQLIISSDNNLAKDDFDLIKMQVIQNPNSQVWIRNGEHDWDFAIRNLQPALEYAGDVFFGRIKMNQ